MEFVVLKIIKKDFFCPVCSHTIENFIPLPEFYAENTKKYGYIYFGRGEMTAVETYTCPDCGSSDRERLYALWLRKKIVHKKLKMLHIAPEPSLSKFIKTLKLLKYKTADLMMNHVDYKIDMMNMPFKDNSYDCFICSHVLEHVESDDKAISELYRILKPKGWGILMVPICTEISQTLEDPSHISEEDRWRYYGQNDHVRLYSHDDYVKKITQHKFKISELDINYFGKDIFIQLGLKESSILYIVEKS